MKKVLSLFAIVTLIFGQFSNVNALSSINYTYNYKNYSSKIEKVYHDDDYVNCDFTENGLDITLQVDKNMRYVIVNDKYYSFEDYNKATFMVSEALYNDGKSMSVVDALKYFNPIENINAYLSNNLVELPQLVNKNSSTISPLASYGVFYYVGSYSKKNMTISLVTSAVGLIVSFITTALTFGAATSYVTGFIAEKTAEWGVSQCMADVWYKKYQAIMNSHGTTKERRYMGLKRSSDSKPSYSSKYIERQFESIRPGY